MDLDKKEPYQALAEEIKSGGFKTLAQIIARKEAEQFFIEFKTTQEQDYSGKNKLLDSDRKNLGKGISGFGNSEGGLLIWGIDARAQNGSDDYAKAIKPIKSPENFRALLESYIKLSTIPSHKSIHNFVVNGSTSGEGVVVTVIPKSSDRPLQNIVDGDLSYYMRAGDSFVKVPDGILRGMFGQEPAADVGLMYTVGDMHAVGGSMIAWEVGLMAVNGGIGMARDIYGHARILMPGKKCFAAFKATAQYAYEYQAAFGIEYSFMSKEDFRLGYAQRSQMAVLELKLAPPFDTEFQVDLLIGSTKQIPHQKSIRKSPEEIQAIFDKYKDNVTNDFFTEIWDSPIM